MSTTMGSTDDTHSTDHTHGPDLGHLSPEEIATLLQGDQQTREWLAHLRALGQPEVAVCLPSPANLPDLLRRLTIPEEDGADLTALLPDSQRTPGWWWLLERAVSWLHRATGPDDEAARLPAMPALLGPAGRYFPAHVFLAMVPHTLALHRERGIASAVSWATLGDLGRHMGRYRVRCSVGGMDPWPTRHLQGKLFELGRLQFERVRLTEPRVRALRAGGASPGASQQVGDLALEVHIPSGAGPLSPQACDDALAAATRFFATHFPEDRFDIAICGSWLLDPQLGEYLPPESNIMRFQRRFHRVCDLDDDGLIQEFVFGRSYDTPEDMPARTTLERAVAQHLRSGRRWHGGIGWFPFEGSRPAA